MAPFNTNQVKYIQAVAGRQQHTTLKAVNKNGTLKSNDFTGENSNLVDGDYCYEPRTFDTTDPLLLAQFALHEFPWAWDCRGVHNNDILESADITDLISTDVGFGYSIGELKCLDVPCVVEQDQTTSHTYGKDRPDDEWISSTQRATPDGFLKSLNLKLRLTLPSNIPVAQPSFADLQPILNKGSGDGVNTQVSIADYHDYWEGVLSNVAKSSAVKGALESWARAHPMHTPHYEFRLIMFRNRLSTIVNRAGSNNLEALRNGVSLMNPGYDLFMGQTGRPRGPLGYRTSPNLDKNMDPNGAPAPYYSGDRWDGSTGFTPGTIPQHSNDAGHGDTTGSSKFPLGEANFTHRDLMTMPLNKNDYVVMRDVRFFLGQAQGKSHYEDVFDFDFNDPINTADTDLLSSDTLSDKNYRWQCVIIGTSNGKDPVHLNYEIRGTTCVQSG